MSTALIPNTRAAYYTCFGIARSSRVDRMPRDVQNAIPTFARRKVGSVSEARAPEVREREGGRRPGAAGERPPEHPLAPRADAAQRPPADDPVPAEFEAD